MQWSGWDKPQFWVKSETAGKTSGKYFPSAPFPYLDVSSFIVYVMTGPAVAISQAWGKEPENLRDICPDINTPAESVLTADSFQTSCDVRKITTYLFKVV